MCVHTRSYIREWRHATLVKGCGDTPTPTFRKGVIFLLFDFDKFANITARVFPDDVGYSLGDALSVFKYYFERYEEHTGHPHPPIRADQIVRIIRAMPWLCETSKLSSCVELEPFCYPSLIDKHFATKYRNCDYNINHFFSGKIRELRFYEELY